MPKTALSPLTLIDRQHAWVKRAVVLSWFTIIYNFIEGIIAMWFGIADESFALFGFGADSFIELASAVLVLWRFRHEIAPSSGSLAGREKTATLGIGILFLLLGLATAVGAGLQLWRHTHPTTTLPGVLVALVSLSFMFYLWKAKLRVADALNSSTMRSDASCSLACIKLSVILLAGSFIFFVLPALWWIDAVAALALSFFIFREGVEIVDSSRKGVSGGCGTCD